MTAPKNLQTSDQESPGEGQPGSPEAGPVDPDAATTPPSDTSSFPIVGMGASAGGLEALETFFSQMPPGSGMAFVIIQHLDPTHKSMLIDLIQRHTRMKVVQVEDGLKVEPNLIHIIPPNRNLTIRQGALYLKPPPPTQRLRLPIDTFFRSLAEDQAEKAIAIILSGAGSDGPLGLKSIKEKGGLVMVQASDSAKYSSMPDSAMATGLVDYVLPPQEMPAQLLKYIELAPLGDKPRPAALMPAATGVLQKIFMLLRTQTGHDFSLYKKNTINRRIERRMAVKQIEQIENYLKYLQQSPGEVQALFKELLIGVTGFFRDAEAFHALETQVMPNLFENRRFEQPVRVWVPGCATGEEAYCLAILLLEQMAAHNREFKVQLFATDIDEEAIDKARLGVYPESIATDVSAERLQHFFTELNGSYQVAEPVRKLVVFATQNVIKDPPFSKLDLISCRNLLIYLEPELQKKVISLFYYALKPGGYLFLGTSETPVELAPFFTMVDRKWKLFQRPENGPDHRAMLDFATPIWISPDLGPTELSHKVDTRTVIEKLVLENYVVPCMIINENSEILFIYGRLGQYLEPSAGEAGTWNILRLVREELRMPLGSAIRQAIAQKQAISYEEVPLKSTAETHLLTLTVRPIFKPPSLQGLLVVLFEARPAPLEVKPDEISPEATAGDQRVAELERELAATKEYLQATIEELESSNEEIKSTNEELQSANEELETSQEEAQSINEELVTLNNELENKVDQLSWVNSDINNILSSIDVGILFLDRHMHIRRFNRAATQVINLIDSDIGRPVDHLMSNLAHDDWLAQAHTVFETLVPEEIEVETEAGVWYLMRIRPYRTVENAIEGVVMTFTNITEQKELIDLTQPARELAENIVNTVRHPLLVLDAELRILSANRAFSEVFQVKAEEAVGQFIYEVGNRRWALPRLRDLLEEIIPRSQVLEDFEVELDFPGLGCRRLRLNARQIKPSKRQPALILLAIEDLTAAG
jgi:two-component system CheB/CheR fusion protein